MKIVGKNVFSREFSQVKKYNHSRGIGLCLFSYIRHGNKLEIQVYPTPKRARYHSISKYEIDVISKEKKAPGQSQGAAYTRVFISIPWY